MGRGSTLARTVFTTPVVCLFLVAGAARPTPTPTPTPAPEQAEFPRPVGHVNDFAEVLSAEETASLESYLRRFRGLTGIEIAVVTLPSIGERPVEEVAVRLFEAWGIGKKGEDRGLLLLDAIAERRIRIEVGYGLEGALPDGLVGEILDEHAVPFLKRGMRGEAYAAALHAAARIALDEIGLDPALADSLPNPARRSVPRRFPLGGFLLGVVLLVLMTVLLGRHGGGFRTGQFGPGGFGGFGGFGGGGRGGFGGFGGGMSGGGGASRGY